tara:strand:+ start:99 stop:425 length:327 start_codon:yes stop_codon:yes gene_type:complete
MPLDADVAEALHYGLLVYFASGPVVGAALSSVARRRRYLELHMVMLGVLVAHWTTNGGECAVNQFIARRRGTRVADEQMLRIPDRTYYALFAMLLASSAAVHRENRAT